MKFREAGAKIDVKCESSADKVSFFWLFFIRSS